MHDAKRQQLVDATHAGFGAVFSEIEFTEGAKRKFPRGVLEVESHR